MKLPYFVQMAIVQQFRKNGYEIHPIGQSGTAYEQVRTAANYAPWNLDAAFQTAYQAVTNHTLVDQYRCYELWKLVEQTSKLSTGAILEVGVWRGGTGALMAKQADLCGIQDSVYLCDTFTGVVKATDKDTIYNGKEHADTSEKIVESLIDALGLTNTKILTGIFPEDTGHLVNDLQFRLVHIDVDVYQSAKDIVDWVWDRLVPGGLIVFDDYGFEMCDGVAKYVDEQYTQPDRLVIHNLNGHAIFIKQPA